ncbi:hypothetical protein ANRL1_02382 [Anaerolineae bacterium]|nr:hypothetical protein ANRL1_02382 [Anaerolineae bacterium]
MNIENVIWMRSVVDKIMRKHDVMPDEVEQLFAGHPRFRFIEKGKTEGEDMYAAMGQTDEGRYLIVYFIRKSPIEALVITAREMESGERGRYGKK